MTTVHFVREGDFMELYSADKAEVQAVADVLQIAVTKAREHGLHAGYWQVGVPCHAWWRCADALRAVGFTVTPEEI